MVEPSKSVVGPEAVAAFAELIGPTDLGAEGFGALQRLVELAPIATDAAGVAFVECCGDKARIVAAGGLLDHLRGRLVPSKVLPLPAASGEAWLCELEPCDLDPNIQGQLAERGLSRVVRAATMVAGRHIGYFLFCYSEGAPSLTPAKRSTIALLTACASGLYSFGDGPRTAEGGAGEWASASDEDHNLFIAVTSHELRTPVTVIRGYADTLVEHWDQLDEQARRSAVTVIGQRARELGRLLDRLLSAAGDGIRPVDHAASVPFDLLDAVRHAVEDLPSDLSHDLRVTLPCVLPKTLGDRTAIATIITELVTNASKYSSGTVDIDLTAGADRAAVWLRVSDRGVGIRPEHTERAFERFWQAESGDQRQRGGVGLGLYLVRRIVERHGGWVSLRPRNGGGTVAEVRLPRADMTPGEA